MRSRWDLDQYLSQGQLLPKTRTLVTCAKSAKLAAAMAPTPFLLVSMERSGSDWVRSMMSSHPHVQCEDEFAVDHRGSELGATSFGELGQSRHPPCS